VISGASLQRGLFGARNLPAQLGHFSPGISVFAAGGILVLSLFAIPSRAYF